jgi:hypothetical protein
LKYGDKIAIGHYSRKIDLYTTKMGETDDVWFKASSGSGSDTFIILQNPDNISDNFNYIRIGSPVRFIKYQSTKILTGERNGNHELRWDDPADKWGYWTIQHTGYSGNDKFQNNSYVFPEMPIDIQLSYYGLWPTTGSLPILGVGLTKYGANNDRYKAHTRGYADGWGPLTLKRR